MRREGESSLSTCNSWPVPVWPFALPPLTPRRTTFSLLLSPPLLFSRLLASASLRTTASTMAIYFGPRELLAHTNSLSHTNFRAHVLRLSSLISFFFPLTLTCITPVLLFAPLVSSPLVNRSLFKHIPLNKISRARCFSLASSLVQLTHMSTEGGGCKREAENTSCRRK